MRTMRKELNMFVKEEICPGVTYQEHAESVARYNLKGVEYNEIRFRAEVLKVLNEIQPELEEAN